MVSRPVARFIDAPFRRESGSAVVLGVPAFSRHGITSVQFTISDGANPDIVTSATTQSWNTVHSDWVWCYNVTVDLTTLNDGALTVTVLVTDGNSDTRTIQQTINNNSGGSMRFHEAWVDSVSGNDGTGTIDSGGAAPFATIMAAADAFGLAHGDDHDPGGCTIYLEEGDHTYGTYSFGQNIESQSADWLKITSAAGADPANVRITASATEGIRGYYIWFDNLTIAINQSTFTGGPRNTTTGTRYLRSSRLIVTDVDYAGQVEAVSCFLNFDFNYHHGNTVSYMRNGWGGELVRAVHYTLLGEDVIPNCVCAVNITCDESELGSYAGTWHPDGIQMFSVNENLLYYNIRMINVNGQLIFQGDALTAANNVAVVNFLGIEKSGSGFQSQLLSGYEHFIMWNVHVSQSFRFDETEVISGLDVRNSYFDSMNAAGGNMATVEASGTIDYCSFGNDTIYGTNGMNGSGLAFTDAPAGDYRLTNSSDGYRAGSTLPTSIPSGVRGSAAPNTPDIGPWLDAAQADMFLSSEALVTTLAFRKGF